MKNPKYPSDRSAVRNQSTPSEPNANTRSASKPKKGGTAKRAKDDAFIEEQPAPKKQCVSKEKKPAEDYEGQPEQKKQSASKEKKAAEEEVPASNPSKKKSRKQQIESPAPVPLVTPAKHSHEKSSKKTARVWTDNEEGDIMHCYLESAKEGLDYSKNRPQFLAKINDSLAHKASNSQLYEKVRRMKRRYESIKNKMAQGNIKEDAFVYKSLHEKELYTLWKQAWGQQHDEDQMEVHHTEAVGDAMHWPSAGEDQTSPGDRGEEDEEEEEEVEEEVESDGGTVTDKEPKVLSTEKAPVSNHIPIKRPVSSTALPNNNSEDRLVYETIMTETRDMVAEVIRDVKKMVETSEAELKALLLSHLGLANGNSRS